MVTKSSRPTKVQRDAVLVAWSGGCAQFADAHLRDADARLIALVVEDDGIGF
ncbi:MAG: hypothetical protein H6631_19010 [Anaerolineaceae bacterium]|nr:hypothetical protein [Anaerolineaceae bacterium]